MATLDEIRTLLNSKFENLDEKLGLGKGENLDDLFNKKLGLKSGETLDEKLGLGKGENLNDLFNKKLGLKPGETLDEKLGLGKGENLDDLFNKKLGLKPGETLDEKLGLGKGENLDDLFNKKLGLKPGENLDEKLDRKFSDMLGVNDTAKVDLPRMEIQLQALAGCVPQAFVKCYAQFVVGMGTSEEYRAQSRGGKTTWTYIKHNNEAMAVSAAHCAVSFRSLDRRRFFIEVPEALRQLVTSVAIPSNFLAMIPSNFLESRSPPQHTDIAVLKLGSFPPGVDLEAVPEWREFSRREENRGMNVAGVALSGSVYGSGSSLPAGEGMIYFVEESGEAGNSGTLMFNVSHKGEVIPFPIGIYLGIKRTGNDRKMRGRILPLPRLDSIQEYYPVASPYPAQNHARNRFQVKQGIHSRSTSVTLKYLTGRSYVTLPSNEKIFGFFIEP